MPLALSTCKFPYFRKKYFFCHCWYFLSEPGFSSDGFVLQNYAYGNVLGIGSKTEDKGMLYTDFQKCIRSKDI